VPLAGPDCLSVSLCQVALQSEWRRRHCPFVRPVSEAAKWRRSLRLCRGACVRIKVSGHLCVKCSCDSVGRRFSQGCFLAKAGPRANRRCVRRWRGTSRETEILRGRLPLFEARLGRGMIESLEWTDPWLNRTHQAFAALCWWWLPAEN
jgi:hypothetical protein